MKKLSMFQKGLAILLTISLAVAGVDIIGWEKFAQAESQATLYGETINALAGDEIKVPIYIKNVENLCGYNVLVSYEADILTMKDIEKGELIKDNKNDPLFATQNEESGSFHALWAGSDAPVVTDGELFVITFDVVDDVTSRTSTIHLECGNEGEIYDSSLNLIELNYIDIAINIGGSTVTTPPSGNTTPSPVKDVLNDFHVYLGYANNSWTESFFHQDKPGIVISGDGDYTFSYMVQDTDTDIHVLLLDTDLEYYDVVTRLKIVPTKLMCGGTNYDIKSYSICYETQADGRNAYRIIFRNPYAGEFEGLGGIKIPVTAGDKVVIDFTVEGMGKKADVKPTSAPSTEPSTPFETVSPVPSEATPFETVSPIPSEAAPSVSPTTTPQVSVTSGPGVTAEPKKDIQYTTIKKPARVKIKKLRRAGRGCAKVIWKKVTCSDGYQIQYSRKRSFAGKKKTTSYGNSAYIYGKSKKKYYVRVRAVNSGLITQTRYGKKYGKWSKVKKIKLK